MQNVNRDLTREEWIIAKTIINAIMVFNSLYCSKGEESELPEENIQKIIEYIDENTSLMAIEDVKIAIDQIYRSKRDGALKVRTGNG